MMILALLKNTLFLGVMCLSLAVSTATLAVKTVSMGAQITTMTAAGAATALAHRKAIAAAVTRAKAKARLRRAVAAAPFVGIAAVGYFEHQDYQEWQQENPNGTLSEYSCEVATISAEVVDEVLQDFPEMVRPSREMVLSLVPECDSVQPKL